MVAIVDKLISEEEMNIPSRTFVVDCSKKKF